MPRSTSWPSQLNVFVTAGSLTASVDISGTYAEQQLELFAFVILNAHHDVLKLLHLQHDATIPPIFSMPVLDENKFKVGYNEHATRWKLVICNNICVWVYM